MAGKKALLKSGGGEGRVGEGAFFIAIKKGKKGENMEMIMSFPVNIHPSECLFVIKWVAMAKRAR